MSESEAILTGRGVSVFRSLLALSDISFSQTFIIIGGVIAAAVVVLIAVLVAVGVWSHRQHQKVHAQVKQHKEGHDEEAPAPSGIQNTEHEAKFVPAKASKAKEPEPEMTVQSVTEDEDEDEEPDNREEYEDEEKPKKKKKKGKKKKKQQEETLEEIEE